MSSFDILSRDGHHRIESVADWGIRCRPQSDKHWKDGFSAKECAKAWFRHTQPSVPAELHALFELHPLTKGFAVREVMPELQTRLDTFGKGRCHDP